MTIEQTRRQAQMAVQRRASTPSSYNAETHTVDLTAATGTRVKRYSWMMDGYYWEQLAITPDAVDLSRVEAGQCPLLNTHNRYELDDQLGITESARFEGEELVLNVKFRETPDALEAEAGVAAGTVRGVSIGYAIDELTLTDVVDEIPVYLATKWRLLEVSLVPVPADPAAGVRSEEGLHPCIIKETRNMPGNSPVGSPAAPETRVDPTPAPAAPVNPNPVPAPAAAAPVPVVDASAARMTAAEAIDFAEQARAFGVDMAAARTWAVELAPDAARARLLEAAAERQRGAAPIVPAQSAARVLHDERDTMRAAIPAALLHRYDPVAYKLEGAARDWMGMSLLEMARHHLETLGHKTRGLSRRELADLAMTQRTHATSDFPSLLANVANKTLRQAYESSPQTFRAWQRRTSAADFRQIQRTQLGDAPALLQVPEGGQFKWGSIGEGKEVYALATYGRIVSITRQVIINDDLDAFTRVPALMGRAAADFESDAAYAPLIANPNMGDGVALFHANHGNLAASGAAIAEATVQAGETAMMSQVGLGGRPIAAMPKFLIVAVKDKVSAQKLLSAVQATQTSGVNVYANAMDLVVEPRLNRSSGAVPWYMAADYNAIDTIEYAYLEGENGVYTEERVGFEVDGVDVKIRLDMGVKAIDHRGLYQNPGTT